MAWSRWQLAEKAFFYDEDIRSTAIPAAPYPPHVEALRRSMLDFSCPFPGYQSLGDAVGGFQFDIPKDQWQSKDTGSALTAVYKIKNEATSIYQGGYLEKKWESFFHDQFFKPLAESTSVSKGDSRRVSRCKYYHDAFRADGNLLWDLFSARGDEADTSELTDFQAEKCPKPDYVFYLPMYHLDAEPRIPMIKDPEALQWNQPPGYSLADPFSWSALKELVGYGLRPTPFRVFHKAPVEASLNCYPWLIVEHKKEGVRRLEETVCCQAVNAGACAVKLNQIAARYAVKLGDDAQIPPIPMVTTIGSRVKVWIMHFARDFYAPSDGIYFSTTRWRICKKGYVMRAIWEGVMTKLEDIVKFQLILENTHTWAMRTFKPLMSSYIDQWKLVHCQVGISAANTALLHRQQMMERCQTVVPMVQSFLNNHSSMELDDSKHSKVTPLLMGLLVQQICTLERQSLTDEMNRIITERIGALNFNSERIASETQQTSQRRTLSTGSHLSGLSSLGPTVDNDDPNDDDYVASQVTGDFQNMRLVPDSSDAESQLRRSTRSNPQKTSTAQPPSADDAPHTPKTHSRASTPLSESTVPRSPNTSTPTVHTFSGRVSDDSPDDDAATLRSPQLSQTQDSDSEVQETPPKSVLFPPNESKWPSGAFSPQPPSSPKPRNIDWDEPFGPVQF